MADLDVKDAAADTDVNSDTEQDSTDVQDNAGQDDTVKTILDDKPKGDAKPEDVKPDWPDDWRDKLAKGDEKTRKRLDRFQSPVDVLTSWKALEQKLSSGDVKSKLPEDATEEQIAAYRKDNGIPDKPEGYLEKLPNGLVIGDEDKDIVNSFLETVHGKNADPAFVAEAIDWYYRTQEESAAARTQSDNDYKAAKDDEMRAEWGAEYRGNINSIKNFLDTGPADENGEPLSALLLGARLADGTPLGSNPSALRWLAKLANDANPAGFVSPGSAGTQAESVQDEIASIEKVMRTDRAAYNKDEKMQARLRQLYDAQEKLGAK